jgi:hypothetical protein
MDASPRDAKPDSVCQKQRALLLLKLPMLARPYARVDRSRVTVDHCMSRMLSRPQQYLSMAAQSTAQQ